MNLQSIVIDNGSGVIKAGFSGEPLPNVKLPSIIGYSRTGAVGVSSGSEYVGDEAEKMAGQLDIYNPIESGVIKDWDQMTKIWEYCFSEELRVDTAEHRVLISESPQTSKFNR